MHLLREYAGRFEIHDCVLQVGVDGVQHIGQPFGLTRCDLLLRISLEAIFISSIAAYVD